MSLFELLPCGSWQASQPSSRITPWAVSPVFATCDGWHGAHVDSGGDFMSQRRGAAWGEWQALQDPASMAG
jgi:hypothetical protein